MDCNKISLQLQKNKETFLGLLSGLSSEEYLWRSEPSSWCLLEIVCHLYDEEREDFRTRLKYTLETPELPPPPFDPVVWVKERKYIDQAYELVLSNFLNERDQSIRWLYSLRSPKWDNAYQHPKLGPMSAHHYICNWLAHDYLHIRQILKNKYGYLKEISKNDLLYAGNW